MPAARGVKRSASKSSAATASTGPKNKKKRGAIQLEIPSAPKKRGCVFTCGQGDVGQLGLGEDVIETTKFKYVSALGNKIVDARAGGMHTIALDCDGKVWTFGCNDEGALGRAAASDRDEGTPHAVALPAAAVAVAAGDSHSAALTTAGDVYAWGAFRDSHGSMGLVVRGREGKACREPVKVDIGEPAVAIASGGDHLVILSTSGSVYTMGCGEQGQLGRLSQRSASRDTRQGFSALLVPSKVMLKSGASRIWAGYHATFALDATTDKMFAWGLNNYGQLGITGEKRKTAIFSPTWCDAFSSAASEGAEGGEGGAWAAVAAGQHHTLAADAAGVLHALGRREYGRLGLGEKSGDAEVLEPIPKLQNKKCISIASGTSNSFAVTDDGEVYAWGMGSEGQLGTGGRADCSEPAHVLPVAAPSAAAHTVAVSISAGGQHSVLLQEDPTAQKEASPAPDKEMEEEKVENVEKEEKRPNKRQKKQEQDEEISSTSSAQPADVAVEKPEKVNGNEKKEPEIEPETETPMEVDDTDKAQDNKDDKQIDEPMEQTDSEKSQDTSSQEGTDVETKADDLTDTPDTAQTAPAQAQTTPDQAQAQTQPQAQDTEVNGTVETKPVVLTTA